MIRRTSTQPELRLESLTDTMTNMMGLILLMVVVAVLMSGGMRLVLLGELTDPAGRRPIYLVCKDGRVLYLHRGDQWHRELAQACKPLAERLGRKPTTTEALLEANRLGLGHSEDFQATYVREIARETGEEVYVIGIRFFLRTDGPEPAQGEVFSPAAAAAVAEADPDQHYIDAFVYPTGTGALKALQALAKAPRLRLGWRPMLSHQNPGLSDYGVPGAVGGEE